MSEQLNVDINRATAYNSNINYHNQHIDDSGFLPIQEIKTADISRVLTKETLQTQSSTSLTLTNSSNSPTNQTTSFEDEDNTSLFEFLYDETEGDNNNGSGGGELLSLPLTTLELPVTPPVDEEEQLKQQAQQQQAEAPQVHSGLLPIETCAATLLTPYSAVSLSASSSDSTNNLNSSFTSSNYSSSSSLALSTAAAIAQSSRSAILPGAFINNSNNLLNLSDIPTSLAAPKNNKISPKKKGRARSNSKSLGNKKKSPKRKKAANTKKKAAAPTTTNKKPVRRPRTVTISNSVGSLMQPIINNNNNMDNQEGSPDDAPPQVTSGIAPATHAVAQQGGGLYHPPRSSSVRQEQTTASNTISTLSPSTGNIENTGRWTAEEHRLFLQGLEQHGKGWKKIATLIKSRTVVQIRTHAQKYFQKLAKARQNGEAVPVQQGAGQHQVQVSAQVDIHHAPLGVDGQPVVTMRTTTNPISTQYPAPQNMALGNDPASLAAAAGNVNISTGNPYQARGRKRRSNTVPGGTKRRVIGNVVRSAVKEGRNIKRQKIAEAKRSAAAGGGGGIKGKEATTPGAPLPTIKEDVPGKFEVPNPLPAVSQMLDPYVVTSEMAPLPANAPNATGAANAKNQAVRGRQQLVNTATHGTLPMAALEDAVFRLLTPATGGPAQATANGTVVNPLAPQAKIAVNHTQYGHPPTTVTTTVGTTGNPSPTGVADMLLPSWVDTKNPPQWYADGGDIDTLLEDVEALNWLSDAGDLNETYPPAMVEPTAVVSSSNTAVPSIASIEPNPVEAVTAQQQDPTGGVVHPSADSLSFLMDPPESQPAVAAPNAAPPKQLPTFLENPPAPVEQPPTSATEALMADNTSSATEGIPKLAGVGESVTNLMGFPDVDDEQAFVSALLDNSGQSTMSFPKLSGVTLDNHGSEDKTEEK